jgi:hypothetical protein
MGAIIELKKGALTIVIILGFELTTGFSIRYPDFRFKEQFKQSIPYNGSNTEKWISNSPGSYSSVKVIHIDDHRSGCSNSSAMIKVQAGSIYTSMVFYKNCILINVTKGILQSGTTGRFENEVT